MRKMYCPACAGEVEQRAKVNFECPFNRLSARLGAAMRSAVEKANPPKSTPRAPAVGDGYWCPNCTTVLDDNDERGKELRCSSCALALPAALHAELEQLHISHREAIERYGHEYYFIKPPD